MLIGTQPSSAPSTEDALQSAMRDAARLMSPQGMQALQAAVDALAGLRRGERIPLLFARQAPALARAIGEDAVAQFARELAHMTQKTSAAVIEKVIESAPLAAARLGDEALFLSYLSLLGLLAAQAPRGLRPMLEKSGQLLSQLPLGGLRRWVQWGVQAHRTDFDAQQRYFSLESAESVAVLQQERRGTLFVDVQRRLDIYLRALFGRGFAMRPTSGDFEARQGYRPAIEDFQIHVPDAYDDENGIAGGDIYRAAVLHCAAHLVFTNEALPAADLTPLQKDAIGIVEDARIEALALARFPNVRALWAAQHAGVTAGPDTAAGCLARVARALADPGWPCNDALVAFARQAFMEADVQSNAASMEIGMALAARLESAGMDAYRSGALPMPAYRDDNRYAFAFSADTLLAIEEHFALPRQQRKTVNLMQFVNEIDSELAGEADEVWVLQSELYPYEDDGVSYNAREAQERPAPPVLYPEWDYRAQSMRPDWVQLVERRVEAGRADAFDAVLAEHRPLLGRLRRVIEALQPQGVQRLRRQENGDELDLNAVIDAWIDRARGDVPEERLMMRCRRHVRDIAVLILLDLSESTNTAAGDAGKTILQLTLEAAALTAHTLERIGDPFAVHGFQSNGREQVNYLRFKDFGQKLDEGAKARLAGMQGRLSTRMGAAMRHATRLLRRQPQRQKLLLVLTDGDPADIDERDPQTLRHDARKAVEEAARAGVTSFCLSLDRNADAYVSRIFGSRNYLVLDNVRALPERLPLLYASLTRR